MKIILCCAGGLSTTMLMDSMKTVIKNSQKLNIEDFQFDAIPVDSLQNEIENYDVVVLGPQIAHKQDSVRKMADPLDIPVIVVDSATYGQMDGATVLKKCLVERKKADMKKGK